MRQTGPMLMYRDGRNAQGPSRRLAQSKLCPGGEQCAAHLARLALLAVALPQVLHAPPLVVALELAPAALFGALELADVLEAAALQDQGVAGRAAVSGGGLDWRGSSAVVWGGWKARMAV